MNKILFLDIDGVLNDATGPQIIDPQRLAHINRIVAETGCDVVLSTSWVRHHGQPYVTKMLRDAGFKGRIVGATLSPTTSTRLTRGEEIAALLEARPNIDVFGCG